MGILKRGDSQKIILIKNGCSEFEIKSVTKDGNSLKEPLSSSSYTIAGHPISLKDGVKRESAYIVDQEKGVTVCLTRDKELLELSTNPKLVSSILDTSLLEQAFGLKPDTKTIFISFVLGGIFGWLF